MSPAMTWSGARRRPGEVVDGVEPGRPLAVIVGVLVEDGAAERAAGRRDLLARFKRAIAEGDLHRGADAGALASYVQTVIFGLTVQAATGASRKELLRVIDMASCAWPT